MNKKWTTALVVLACLALAGIALAQVSSNYNNSWHVLGAGGSQSMSSSNYTVHATLGQSVIGPAAGAQYAAGLGYWYGAAGGETVLVGPGMMRATTPFAIQVYYLTITNTGNSADVLNLSHASDLGWTTLYPATLSLGAGLSAQVAVTVEIPFVATNWITETTVFTATSQNNGSQAAAMMATWTGGYWHIGFGKYVGCRYDLNYNGQVDFVNDIQAVAGRYGSTTELKYDFNHNGSVDFVGDIQSAAGRYGQICSAP
jgi:hypothetical protein